ncbi:AAA family ATPase [Allohahella sp. A8]|uniref:AAA family ATPase n=1 Tax=Allohahella sp. A8 TaxID=3141461 RepID=UPI003A8108DE
MRLLRLSLENWRGVAVRDITFSDSVTLIEGPNEIGKSTLVEALRTLFAELDSSNKKSVKAIQPVGEDVGSRVEAEVVTGDYHFVYSKTYNRKSQTTLRILKPEPAQYTGREAHELAEQMLSSTIDTSLWHALLVEQGKEIRAAGLSESAGLARALDAAVGSAANEQDDAGLYERVQAEYEQYFSLKTGKPKFSRLDTEIAELEAAVADAIAQLNDIVTDTAEYERCLAEVQRLEKVGPELQLTLAQREAEWKVISSIEQQVRGTRDALETARQLWQAVQDEVSRRERFAAQCRNDHELLDQKRRDLERFLTELESLQSERDAAALNLQSLKNERLQTLAHLESARADLQHLERVAILEREQQRLDQCRSLSEQLAADRAVMAGIRTDATRLDALQKSESQLQVAIGQRDLATTVVEWSARKDLTLEVDGKSVNLLQGSSESRRAIAEMVISIPGVADFRIRPSQSTSELEQKVSQARQLVNAALDRCGVESLAEAFAAEARRQQAATNLKMLVDRRKALLGSDDEAELQARLEQMRLACEDYLQARNSDRPIPDDHAKARLLVKELDQAFKDAEQAVEAALAVYEHARSRFEEAHASQRVASQEVVGLDNDLQRRQAELAEAERSESVEVLRQRLQARTRETSDLALKLERLEQELAESPVETVEALLVNARASRDRASKDLAQQATRLAVLEDRLAKAQADGRKEKLDLAERKHLERKRYVAGVKRRAAAVQRLWECVDRHRNATRKAYLQPLKEGIESLGRIVFGADFEITLADDWSLSSCTRRGRTIPFDGLSVGAKEQLGILTRLAAAKIVSRHGGVPVIIDDALGFSDPGRLETMGAALAHCGRHSQIILLTCTPGRFSYVGNAELVRL